MKHIKTASDEEVKAKEEYATLKSDEPVIADAQAEDYARRLYALMRQADENEREMSRLRGLLMATMKDHAYLKNKDGVLLCSWVNGNSRSTTDWDGLCAKFNITDADRKAFTHRMAGSRRFSVELEG